MGALGAGAAGFNAPVLIKRHAGLLTSGAPMVGRRVDKRHDFKHVCGALL